MNKKDQFIVARAIAQAFVDGDKRSDEAQHFMNNLTTILKYDLEDAYPKFKGDAFVSLVNTAIALAIQHGNAPGKLTSIESNGITYP
jgi:hypothetical protein